MEFNDKGLIITRPYSRPDFRMCVSLTAESAPSPAHLQCDRGWLASFPPLKLCLYVMNFRHAIPLHHDRRFPRGGENDLYF